MDKFSRNYSFYAQGIFQSVTVQPPFTIEFDITKNLANSSNSSSFRIYNLSRQNRDILRQDQTNLGVFKRLIFKAGYGDALPIVFNGNLMRAWSVRQGVDYITTVEPFMGGFDYLNAHGPTTPFPAIGAQRDVLRYLIESLPSGVSLGKIGNYNTTIKRGGAYSGSTIDLIQELSGKGFFIDDGVANVLNDNECLTGTITELTSENGLLGTPVRQQNFVYIDMLFEPGIKIGQRLKITSMINDDFNGDYKVNSLHHKGIISESICGNATTSLCLINGNGILTDV